MLGAVQSYTLSPEKYIQAVQYAHLRYALHFAGVVVSVLALLGMLRLQMAGRWVLRPEGLRIGAVLLLLALVDLPLRMIHHAAATRFGISVESWPAWFWDWTKEQIAGLLIGIALIWGFYVLVRKSPR